MMKTMMKTTMMKTTLVKTAMMKSTMKTTLVKAAMMKSTMMKTTVMKTMMNQLTDEYNDDAVNVNRSTSVTCDAGRRIKCRDNIYHMKSMIKGCQTLMQVRKALDHIKCSILTAGELRCRQC